MSPTGIRLPPELKRRIRESAATHDRSFNAEVLFLLKSALRGTPEEIERALLALADALNAPPPELAKAGRLDLLAEERALLESFRKVPDDKRPLILEVVAGFARSDRNGSVFEDMPTRRSRPVRQTVQDRLTTLTSQERRVLDLMVAGHTAKGIAAELGISQRTVEVHRAHIMEKMGAGSVEDLVGAIQPVS